MRALIIVACLTLLSACLPHFDHPVGPANLTASAGNATVTLSWTATQGATSYNVKRATKDGGPYTQVATPTTNGYTDSGVTNGTAYYYVVSSLTGDGESQNSTQASATPLPPPPAPPTDLRAIPDNTQVTLTWTASDSATSYHVKRATTSGGPYTQIAAPTSPTYTDTGLTNGATYYYVVTAVNAAGESANSAEVSAVPAIPTIPLAPTNVVAAAGNTQATVTWSASTGATSYHVKRSTTNGGPYTLIATATSTSYVDTGLTNGTSYYYVVSALNSAGESPDSTQAVAVPSAPNPPPTTFGTWTNVTPAGVDLTNTLCGNVGTQFIQADATHPSNMYTQFNCQGIWKSVDYGQTWTGPINAGANAAVVSDCVGGIRVVPSGSASAPTMYQGCIRGNGTGFWKSVDGGVNWTRYTVVSSAARQDYYPPDVDPYDPNHLIMVGHEFDSVVQSADGGQTWTSVTIASGMSETGRTGFIYFIDTASAATTRGTWLFLAEQSGGQVGTWRTANGGTTWVQVDRNEHLLGSAQIFQDPFNNGVVYMAGAGSGLGFGVLRSADFGQTWTHVGATSTQNLVWGTSKNVYSMGLGNNDPLFEVASQPGTGTWVSPGTPPALTQALRVAVVNDGTSNIFVGAMGLSGLWRYVEP
jgi:fibronectin type 3 domain-containing protein